MQVHALFTAAVVASIAAFLLSRILLLRRPHLDHRLLADGRAVALYAVSKLSPVLAVAFAVAADASQGTTPTNAAIGALALLFVAGLTTWTVHARLTGRFFGLAHNFRAR